MVVIMKIFDSEIKFANENKINIYTLALGSTSGFSYKTKWWKFLTEKRWRYCKCEIKWINKRIKS